MSDNYKIEKLEDMPKYVPIIFIKDNGVKNSKPRMVGNDIHDEIVIEPNGTQLYYYNLQCGESSHECSDFRFIKREAVCFDDELYSRCCQKVDLEKLIADYTKQVRKEVVGELIVDVRSLFNSYASSLIDYCIWNKNSDENQKLYNNFKRVINDRLEKVLELFDKRIDKIQGEEHENNK